jgi:metallophosphoesterase (TIGR00282 family)
MTNLLMIGDIFGSVGRRSLKRHLPGLIKEHRLDLVVANGENAAGGLGITAKVAGDIFQQGVQVITTGNHVWKQKDLIGYIDSEPRLLRPANYPDENPGQGYIITRTGSGAKVAVVNLEGRVFMSTLGCPFVTMDRLLDGPLKEADFILVDFHAEATSEKQALAYYLDGRVTAIVGTHTHVQTADERILPQGSAYITDLGMTGPHDSVIGMNPPTAIKRFITQRPQGFKVSSRDPWLQGAIIKAEVSAGRAESIHRISLQG